MELDPGIHIGSTWFVLETGCDRSGVELHLVQGLGEKDVEPTSTVDEDLVELGARDHWLQDEWEPS
jgi:hypothetical protein